MDDTVISRAIVESYIKDFLDSLEVAVLEEPVYGRDNLRHLFPAVLDGSIREVLLTDDSFGDQFSQPVDDDMKVRLLSLDHLFFINAEEFRENAHSVLPFFS